MASHDRRRAAPRTPDRCGLRPQQISDLSASLVNIARQDCMTLENFATDMPLTEDFAHPPLPAARGLARCRSICPASAMNDPAARQITQACAAAG